MNCVKCFMKKNDLRINERFAIKLRDNSADDIKYYINKYYDLVSEENDIKLSNYALIGLLKGIYSVEKLEHPIIKWMRKNLSDDVEIIPFSVINKKK